MNATLSTLKQLDEQLNAMVLNGQAMEAFEQFYADDVVMQENEKEPTVGKAANRERELQFFASVEQFHGAAVTASAVGDGVSFVEWEMDLTFKGGSRVMLRQVSVRHWKDGKIVREKFYYDGAH